MKITKAHGNGGQQTQELINRVFKKNFNSAILREAGDAASLQVDGTKMGMTIDGFIVKPYRFCGGNIGKLAVCGTVNDLAVSGFKPHFLSAAFQIEEGFDIDELEFIAHSMAQTAQSCNVEIVAGDTKVVSKGEMDGIFITTSGVGFPWVDRLPSFQKMHSGQVILLSGDIGRHGACIYSHNVQIGIEQPIQSDCASLCQVAEKLYRECDVAYMRDLTRGGLATTLNELAEGAGCTLTIKEPAIPVAAEVAGLCDILGLDAFYLACEGRLVVIVEAADQEKALAILQREDQDATVAGEVGASGETMVLLQTVFGGTRCLDRLSYEMLPRIC